MYIDETAKEKFSNQVLERVTLTKLSFMDAIIELAEEMGIDPGTAGKLVSRPIVEKIQISNLYNFSKELLLMQIQRKLTY